MSTYLSPWCGGVRWRGQGCDYVYWSLSPQGVGVDVDDSMMDPVSLSFFHPPKQTPTTGTQHRVPTTLQMTTRQGSSQASTGCSYSIVILVIVKYRLIVRICTSHHIRQTIGSGTFRNVQIFIPYAVWCTTDRLHVR